MHRRVNLGGALKKDKTFYFFSYEYTQREESGYSSIGIGQFGLTHVRIPGVGLPAERIGLTSSQSAATLQVLEAAASATVQRKQRPCSSWPGAMQH